MPMGAFGAPSHPSRLRWAYGLPVARRRFCSGVRTVCLRYALDAQNDTMSNQIELIRGERSRVDRPWILPSSFDNATRDR